MQTGNQGGLKGLLLRERSTNLQYLHTVDFQDCFLFPSKTLRKQPLNYASGKGSQVLKVSSKAKCERVLAIRIT